MSAALRDVANAHRLAGLEDLSSNPLIPGNRCSSRDRLLTNRDAKHELFCFRICEQYRAGFGVYLFQGAAKCDLDDFIQLGVAKQRLADPGHSLHLMPRLSQLLLVLSGSVHVIFSHWRSLHRETGAYCVLRDRTESSPIRLVQGSSSRAEMGFIKQYH